MANTRAPAQGGGDNEAKRPGPHHGGGGRPSPSKTARPQTPHHRRGAGGIPWGGGGGWPPARHHIYICVHTHERFGVQGSRWALKHGRDQEPESPGFMSATRLSTSLFPNCSMCLWWPLGSVLASPTLVLLALSILQFTII